MSGRYVACPEATKFARNVVHAKKSRDDVSTFVIFFTNRVAQLAGSAVRYGAA